MYPNKKKLRQEHQEACVDEQGTPGQPQMQNGSVEVGTSSVGGMHRNCLSNQRSG